MSPRRMTAVALVAVFAPLAGSAPLSSAAPYGAGSPPAFSPVVEVLSRGTVAEPFKAEAHGIKLEADRPIDVAVAHFTFAPGSSTGWHKHPGPTVVTVTTGQLTVTSRRCVRHTYTAGETFVEGPRRHLAVNTSTGTTESIVTFFVPTGSDALTIPSRVPRCAR